MADPITLGSKTIVGAFNYYPDKSSTFAVRYMYSHDINGDGSDEVIFAGFESQGAGSGTYSNTNIEIYGWVNGKLAPVTSQWLPNGTNQVQGVGDIGFGDFNGDGKVDLFLTAYTDRSVSAEMYALINKGGSFERVDLGAGTFQHGVAVGDINKDGYDDVYVPNWPNTMVFWGSANGLTKSVTSGAYGGGADAALGDFLGDGTVSVVVTDNDASSNRDINLYSISVNNGVASLTKVSTLPQPLLVDPTTSTKSHDVRARAMDFNNDGKLDVVVFSRADTPNGFPEVSQVQFYKNTGGGNFEDVTASLLSGWKKNSFVSYSPVIGDFNGDGKLDIFSSESAFGDSVSTTMLIQQSDGSFVDTARTLLSSVVDPNGGIATLAKGPDGNFYVVTETDYVGGPDGLNAVIAEYQMQLASNAPVVVAPPPVVVTPPVVVAPVVVPPPVVVAPPPVVVTPPPVVDNPPVVVAPVVVQPVAPVVPKLPEVHVAFDGTWGKFTGAYNAGSPGHSGTGTTVSLNGYNQVAEMVRGSGAGDVLKITTDHVALVLEDDYNIHTVKTGSQARISGISKIELANGDNIVDMTSTKYSFGDVTIVGGTGDDVIWANDGNDTLIGGAGKNMLFGGAGKDNFVFNTAPKDINTVMDFVHLTDQIELDHTVFAKFTAGQSVSNNIAFGLDKETATSYIVYDKGTLYYDADGAGGQAPVAFATLTGTPTLTASDFVIL